MDLRRQIAVVRAWFPLLIVAAALAGAAGFLASSLQQKTYEAHATLNVGQSLSAANPDYNQLLVSQRLSTTYARVATTQPVLGSVIRELGLNQTTDELAKRIHADAAIDSTLLTVTAQDTDPVRAAAIANSLANRLIASSPAVQGAQTDIQKSIAAELEATRAQIDATQAAVERLGALASPNPDDVGALGTLQGRLVTLRSTYATLLASTYASASNQLSVVDPAVAPISPTSPRPLLNALLAAALGLLVAGGIVVLTESLDDSIKDPETVEDVLQLSTMGMIGRMKGGKGHREMYRLAALLYPRSATAETYRTLRSNVEFASIDAPIRTLLVTSSVPGEGKTVTAANLAVVFAQAGRLVLLVDADLRKPGVHGIFNVPNERGLTTLLRDEQAVLETILQDTEQPGLRLLTTGPLPPNPAELLGSQRMRQALDRLLAVAELIVIDSPPLQAVADAAVLSSRVDGTLLVIDTSRGHRRAVRDSREALARAGAKVLGVVINRLPATAGANYAAYYRASDGLEEASVVRSGAE